MSKLSRVNTCLLVAIVLVNGYLVAMPFVPSLIFRHNHGATAKKLTQKIQQSSKSSSGGNTPSKGDEELIVPSMGLDETVHEGKYMNTLNLGLWHRPNTSAPDKGGNTVIVGHRFTYTNPRGTFYYLDKVHQGDQIGLIWHGKTYQYKVTTVKVVPPTAVEIENNTASPQLTLYTCTPLWWPKDRLVVIATPLTETQP